MALNTLCRVCGGARVYGPTLEPCWACTAPTEAEQEPLADVVELLVIDTIARLMRIDRKEVPRMMEKYGVDRRAAEELLKKGLVKTVEEGIEKVASGEAEALLREKKGGGSGGSKAK